MEREENAFFIFFRKELTISLKESEFQSRLIKKIEDRFPGAIIMKNDATYRQGFPDLTVLYEDRWAVLETKRNSKSHHQPNQDYYVDILNKMSYSTFVNPDNFLEVLDELEQTFKA